jgi:hypothetical protein
MARLVSLEALCAEGFASSPSELLLTAVDRGWPLGFDGGGQVGVRVAQADKLRQERREAEAREARERELARAEQQDAEVAALVAQSKRAQLRERERRVEEALGAPLWQVDALMRREEWLRPDTAGSLTDRDQIARRDFGIEDYEAFAADYLGRDLDMASA